MTGRTPDTVYDQLDRVSAQLAHLQATMQRVLVALERLLAKPPSDYDDATRG